MATYKELYGLHNDSALRNRVLVACIVGAEGVMNELDTTPNYANRLLWAASVLASPRTEADRMFMAVLAANKDASVEVIRAAADELIQANVDDHIDLFAAESVV